MMLTLQWDTIEMNTPRNILQECYALAASRGVFISTASHCTEACIKYSDRASSEKTGVLAVAVTPKLWECCLLGLVALGLA